MERLIADANRVKEANGEMADLSIDSFADIVEAIHIMQGEMNISGTTAAEASTTIQGSINSMKAAWDNLLVGLAAGDQDISTLMDNLLGTIFGIEDETGNRVGGVVNNILPRVSAVLSALSTEVREYLPEIMAYIPQILEEVLPDLIKNATALVTAFVGELPNIINIVVQQLPLLLSSIGDALIQGFNSLTENLPAIADSLSGVLSAVLTYVSKNADTLISSAADFFSTLLTESIGILADNTDELVSAFMAVIKALIKAAFEHPELAAAVIGMKAITSLGGTVVTALGTAISNGKTALGKTIGNLISGAFGSASGDKGSIGKAAGNIGAGTGSKSSRGGAASEIMGVVGETLGVVGVSYAIMQFADDVATAVRHNSESWKAEEAVLDEIYASTDVFGGLQDRLTHSLTEQGLQILENGGSWLDVAHSMGYTGQAAQGVFVNLQEMYDNDYDVYASLKDLNIGLNDVGAGMEDTAGKTSSSTEAIRNAVVTEFNKAAMEATRVGTTMSSNFSGSMLAGQPTAVATATNFVTASMNAMRAGIKAKQSDVTGAVSDVETGMETSINPVKGAMTSAGNDSASNLDTSFGSWAVTVEQTVTRMYNLFQTILGHALVNDMSIWGSQIGSSLNTGLQSGGSGIGSSVNNLSSNISSAFKWLADDLWNSGWYAGQGLYNGLANWAGSLQSLARSIANTISATLRNALAIRSPSRVMEQIGLYTGEGLAIGIEDSSAGAVDAAKGMAAGVIAAAGSAVDTINGETIQTALAGSYSAQITGTISRMDPVGDQTSVSGLLQQLLSAVNVLSQMQMVMDTGEVVGVLASPMNNELASIRLRERRG